QLAEIVSQGNRTDANRRFPFFFRPPASPDAQNRSRWKSKKTAGNLKDLRKRKSPAGPEIFRRRFQNSAGKSGNLPENKFSSRKSKPPLEIWKICRKIKKSAGK